MSVDVEIPQPFETGVDLSGAVDLDLDNIHFNVDTLPPINLNLTSTNQVNSESQLALTSNSELKANLGLDAGLDLKSNSQVDVKSDSNVKTESKLSSESKLSFNSDSQIDVGLDNIHIKAFPEIKFRAGLLPMKLKFPVCFSWRFSMFGCEIFNIEISGESKLVVDL